MSIKKEVGRGSGDDTATQGLLILYGLGNPGLAKRLGVRLKKAAGSVIGLQDVVKLFTSDRRFTAFRKCNIRAKELIAECTINLLILDGVITPLGLDTYRVNAS